MHPNGIYAFLGITLYIQVYTNVVPSFCLFLFLLSSPPLSPSQPPLLHSYSSINPHSCILLPVMSIFLSNHIWWLLFLLSFIWIYRCQLDGMSFHIIQIIHSHTLCYSIIECGKSQIPRKNEWQEMENVYIHGVAQCTNMNLNADFFPPKKLHFKMKHTQNRNASNVGEKNKGKQWSKNFFNPMQRRFFIVRIVISSVHNSNVCVTKPHFLLNFFSWDF